MQYMRVQSLGWEDSLEKEMATHSSSFSWEILWTEEPGGHVGSQRVLATKQQQQFTLEKIHRKKKMHDFIFALS